MLEPTRLTPQAVTTHPTSRSHPTATPRHPLLVTRPSYALCEHPDPLDRAPDRSLVPDGTALNRLPNDMLESQTVPKPRPRTRPLVHTPDTVSLTRSLVYHRPRSLTRHARPLTPPAAPPPLPTPPLSYSTFGPCCCPAVPYATSRVKGVRVKASRGDEGVWEDYWVPGVYYR
ncbi:hypothetical protein FIBSPDRAFT_890802 [Athelia psychrophila]|uniref:Uncharacterized protein n=1 Tax=Athelia psychrophila TaxID=1759441 RepID=A0A166KKT5_9AGAM|nr:hypothetical protein FIBSPDRAFT_890802 [Fibularhizoctonia sp. CBS 109695]